MTDKPKYNDEEVAEIVRIGQGIMNTLGGCRTDLALEALSGAVGMTFAGLAALDIDESEIYLRAMAHCSELPRRIGHHLRSGVTDTEAEEHVN